MLDFRIYWMCFSDNSRKFWEHGNKTKKENENENERYFSLMQI